MCQIPQVGVAKRKDCSYFLTAPSMMSLVALLIALSFCRVAQAQYIVGADIGYLKQAEDGGTVFKENNGAKPALEILKDHDYNWVRLRLFVKPTGLANNLSYNIASAPGEFLTRGLPNGTLTQSHFGVERVQICEGPAIPKRVYSNCQEPN
jgi:hypothetical protein